MSATAPAKESSAPWLEPTSEAGADPSRPSSDIAPPGPIAAVDDIEPVRPLTEEPVADAP